MVIVEKLERPQVQQAITELEDMLKKLGDVSYGAVWMTVAVGSPGIPTGHGVKMTANNTVDLYDGAGYVGVNVGPNGVAGGRVLIRAGGPPAEVMMIAGENPQAGNVIYYSNASPGNFTITPVLGSQAVGTIYDRHLYVIGTGGLVKAFLDDFIAGGPP